jgi:hypothetical protein
MASNVLTAIAPILFRALNTVSRERVGFVSAVARDSRAETAAVGQTVKYHRVPAASLENVTPGQLPADTGGVTPTAGDMTIANSKVYPIYWSGEDEKLLSNGDEAMLASVQMDQYKQGFRTLGNAVEADLAALHIEASRAYGAAGTTPFATINEMDDASEVLRILKDNGLPLGEDMSLVLGSAAIAKLQGYQPFMFRKNEGQPVSSGEVPRLFDAGVYESAQIKTHTAGTGATVKTNTAGYAVGATVITLKSSGGTGTLVAGDVITFAGDTNQYVITSGDGDISNGGTFTLAAPGLRAAIPAAETAITVVAASVRNMAFGRRAIQLVTRGPAMPKGGDAAAAVMNLRDPISGLIYQVAEYPAYRARKIEIGLAWGVETVNPEHVALLLG